MNNLIKLSVEDFSKATPILVIHQSGAGGKTITNLLGLSDDCVFQHHIAIQLQKNKLFSVNEKIKFLLDRLEKSKSEKNWSDLNMGEPFFLYPNFESPLTKDYSRENFYEEMRWVIDSKKYFFLSAHNLQEVKITLKIWPNCKIIFLTNSYDFIVNKRKNYKFTLQNEWNNIRGSDWPERFPKNLDEYYDLDNYIIKEIEEMYDNMFYDTLVLFDEKLFEKEMNKITSNFYFKWDVEWFYDDRKVVKELSNLYNVLNINNFDMYAVKNYFNPWFSNVIK